MASVIIICIGWKNKSWEIKDFVGTHLSVPACTVCDSSITRPILILLIPLWISYEYDLVIHAGSTSRMYVRKTKSEAAHGFRYVVHNILYVSITKMFLCPHCARGRGGGVHEPSPNGHIIYSMFVSMYVCVSFVHTSCPYLGLVWIRLIIMTRELHTEYILYIVAGHSSFIS